MWADLSPVAGRPESQDRHRRGSHLRSAAQQDVPVRSLSSSVGPCGLRAKGLIHRSVSERGIVDSLVARRRASLRVADLNTWSQIRQDDPLNLSISVSGGKETNKDSPSNGE